MQGRWRGGWPEVLGARNLRHLAPASAWAQWLPSSLLLSTVPKAGPVFCVHGCRVGCCLRQQAGGAECGAAWTGRAGALGGAGAQPRLLASLSLLRKLPFCAIAGRCCARARRFTAGRLAGSSNGRGVSWRILLLMFGEQVRLSTAEEVEKAAKEYPLGKEALAAAGDEACALQASSGLLHNHRLTPCGWPLSPLALHLARPA